MTATPDSRALAELHALKDRIGDRLDQPGTPAHVEQKLLAEFRMCVLAILSIERSKPPTRTTTNKADELRARRAARHAARPAPPAANLEDTQ